MSSDKKNEAFVKEFRSISKGIQIVLAKMNRLNKEGYISALPAEATDIIYLCAYRAGLSKAHQILSGKGRKK